MENQWKQQGFPHKGWTLLDVIDVREDGQSEEETDYETFMMCGNEKIRYVHIVEHKEIAKEFRVDYNCASKLTEDYINPEKREKELRNRAKKRINWVKIKWKSSKNENYYLTIEERHILIFRDKKTNKFKVKIA
jgi:hypothetical protein